MDKLLSRIAAVDITSIVSKVKGAVLSYTEYQMKVEEATTDHPWGASSSLMQDIASGTFGYQTFHDIMDMIYTKMQERGSSWRQCYKALQLVDYLIRNGAEKVVDSAKEHTYELKALKSFQHIDDKGKDQGLNVRNRAEEILALLADPERITAERLKAKENKGKYSGTSNSSSNYNASSNYNNSSSSNAYPSHREPSSYDNDLPKPIEKVVTPPKAAPQPDLISMKATQNDEDWGDFTDAVTANNPQSIKIGTQPKQNDLNLLDFSIPASNPPSFNAFSVNPISIPSHSGINAPQLSPGLQMGANQMPKIQSQHQVNSFQSGYQMNNNQPLNTTNYQMNNMSNYQPTNNTNYTLPTVTTQTIGNGQAKVSDPFSDLASFGGFTPKKSESKDLKAKTNNTNLMDF